jgi:hypothetical protein
MALTIWTLLVSSGKPDVASDLARIFGEIGTTPMC